jgi:mannose-6-phosphate isomerase
MSNLSKKQPVSEQLPELLNYQEERPWGYFRQFCENSVTTVKIIVILPNEVLSQQSHNQRQEFWRVIAGSGQAEIADQIQEISLGDELIIPLKTKHRLIAGSDGLEILEISFGHFAENDIIRYDDKYGRV